jgi:Hydrolytic ATP binding site of dynein motor region
LKDFDWRRCFRVYQQTTFPLPLLEQKNSADSTVVSASLLPEPVRMQVLDDAFAYGNEFYGIHQTLSITPTTEKCFLGIWLALSFKRPALVQGNAAVGKTYTIKVERFDQDVTRMFISVRFFLSLEFGSISRSISGHLRMFAIRRTISNIDVHHWISDGWLLG